MYRQMQFSACDRNFTFLEKIRHVHGEDPGFRKAPQADHGFLRALQKKVKGDGSRYSLPFP